MNLPGFGSRWVCELNFADIESELIPAALLGGWIAMMSKRNMQQSVGSLVLAWWGRMRGEWGLLRFTGAAVQITCAHIYEFVKTWGEDFKLLEYWTQTICVASICRLCTNLCIFSPMTVCLPWCFTLRSGQKCQPLLSSRNSLSFKTQTPLWIQLTKYSFSIYFSL